ncbi:hypothetical protein [Deefgea sp. CFH1-16]|uniref:hypothetical protein n=1 Tax=Deefgea sp. CFH1-16 TaxID=2675457 RepID=UPI0015F67969|nr:hypothetical protein [Deefgea sp. CFH1-16]MBM5573079.1 hypothetical protein [Deefgea sp. CFH1-16]
MTQEIATSFIMAADLICPATVDGETPSGDAAPYKWLQHISQRFITTRHISGLLESAANMRPAWKAYIQQIGQDVNDLNNRGVQHMLKSEFTEAIDILLPAAQSTCNNRLMLSTSHAIVKYLKTKPNIDKKERDALITVASGMIERLNGLIDAGTQHSLSQDVQTIV